MILEYGEAVKQALGSQHLYALTAMGIAGLGLLAICIIVALSSAKIRGRLELCVLIIVCFLGVSLLFSYEFIKSDTLVKAGLGDESSYYTTQLDEKYNMYALPDMSTNPFLHWWKQEFYAASNETDEVKTYRLEEINEGYLTLVDTEDGKVLGIHQ